MGIVLDRGYYYWVKRIPKRYRGIVKGANGQPVSQVRAALHTDSRREAEEKAAKVEAERMAEWEAMLAGDAGSAARHYAAARDLAAKKGYSYVTAGALSEGDLQEIVRRVLAMAGDKGLEATPAITAAILGAVPVAHPTFPEVLAEYYELTRTRHLQKSDAQRHRWKIPHDRAVRDFVEVTSKRDALDRPIAVPINEITREDALKFRKWWADRVEGGLSAGSANKQIGHLSEIFATWCELKGLDLPNPFTRLSLDGRAQAQRPAFSRDWIRDKLLAPGAFDKANEEARDILFVMINTGLRPSEITDAPLSDYEVDAPIPFIRVAPHGRELKVAHTRREIPLLGVSLDAARRIVARGGIQRYRLKSNNWSATINKFMAENGLKETPAHVAYSLRHYVENALLAEKVDYRVRVDIMGHKNDRPIYGDGGGLAGRAEALARIAL